MKNTCSAMTNHLSAKPSQLRKVSSGAITVIAVLVLALAPVAPSLNAAPAPGKALPQPAPGVNPPGGCVLKSARGQIQHVIYIQFDNVHFRRDNPNVPSDLEQMPHLLNFLTSNGTLLTNHHTPLISHTADDIVTSLTGVYGDRHGQPVANSFDYFTPSGPFFTSSFQYWTDIVDPVNDPTYYMITPDGKNAPAPWVPWTRAGCDVGAFSTANIELENVFGDIATVFATDQPTLTAAQNEVNTNFNAAVADFQGISIHCAQGSTLCANNHSEPDLLPDEPGGGYNGFSALYGNKFVAPAVTGGSTTIFDLDGNPIEDNNVPANIGFPGFDPSASQTLAYVATMQEAGVPVTYAYMADVHDNHSGDWAFFPAICGTDPEFGALGPGDACYEAQLAAYDQAFGKFFDRLAKDGITKDNTLFIITSDENDHFAGGPPFNQGCDGVKVQCVYTMGNNTVIGELGADMAGLLATEKNIAAPFDIHFDMAPAFYINTAPAPGNALSRSFETATAGLTAVNPRTGNVDQLMVAQADPVELKLLHMVTGDPLRTPTYIMFGDADYYFELTGDTTCSTPCVFQNPGNAWNHGGIQPEIVTTWLGMVGPGVKNAGIDGSVWSDETDIRPTMLVLAGLTDDYEHEGRALTEELNHWALPRGVTASDDSFTALAAAFKAINAPVGPLGKASLKISTAALQGNSKTYTHLENQLSNITSIRDMLAGQMLGLLEGAEFNNQPLPQDKANTLIDDAYQLLDYVQNLAQNLNQNQNQNQQ